MMNMKQLRAATSSKLQVTRKRFLATVLTIALALSPAAPWGITPALADDGKLPGITPIINYYPQGGNALSLTDVDWTKTYNHPGHDDAYTPSIDQKYNGYETNNHMVVKDGTVNFFGYAAAPNMDMAYTEHYDVDSTLSTLSFTIRPWIMNYHTFNEFGILVNGSFKGDAYTGHIICLSSGKQDLRLYWTENEVMNMGNFQPSTDRTLVAILKTGITDGSTEPVAVSVGRAQNGMLAISVNGELKATASPPKSAGVGVGFGFYCGYWKHACEILTVMSAQDVKLEMMDAQAQKAKVTVKFADLATGNEIAEEQALKGAVGDYYSLTHETDILNSYQYSHGSRDGLEDPAPLLPEEENDTVTLYYALFADNMDVVKTASAGSAAADPGSEEAPVPVAKNDVITYSITPDNSGSAQENGSFEKTNPTPNSYNGYSNGTKISLYSSDGNYKGAGPMDRIFRYDLGNVSAGKYSFALTTSVQIGTDITSTSVAPHGAITLRIGAKFLPSDTDEATIIGLAKNWDTKDWDAVLVDGLQLTADQVRGCSYYPSPKYAAALDEPLEVGASTQMSLFLVIHAVYDTPDSSFVLYMGGSSGGFDGSAVNHILLSQPIAKITDTIPAGLTYVGGSASPNNAALSPDGRTLTWNTSKLPAGTSGPYTFQAKVTEEGNFVNSADMIYIGSSDDDPLKGALVESNKTYHSTGVTVTENYLDARDKTTPLKTPKRTYVPKNGSYSAPRTTPSAFDGFQIKGGDGILKTARYYGYSTDGGTTVTQSQPPPDPVLTGLTGNAALNLYYMPDTLVNINYRDAANPSAGIALPAGAAKSAAVRPGEPFILDPSLTDSFTDTGGRTWNYAGYDLTGGTAMTAGRPPSPAYGGASTAVGNDKTITLFFTQNPSVEVRSALYSNDVGNAALGVPQVYVKPTERMAVAYGAAFDLNTADPTATADFTDTDGTKYKYVGYQTDGGTYTPSAAPPPPSALSNITANTGVTLYFRYNEPHLEINNSLDLGGIVSGAQLQKNIAIENTGLADANITNIQILAYTRTDSDDTSVPKGEILIGQDDRGKFALSPDAPVTGKVAAAVGDDNGKYTFWNITPTAPIDKGNYSGAFLRVTYDDGTPATIGQPGWPKTVDKPLHVQVSDPAKLEATGVDFNALLGASATPPANSAVIFQKDLPGTIATITLANTANGVPAAISPTGITLSGGAGSAFTVTQSSMSIPANSTDSTWQIAPKPGLPGGDYNETLAIAYFDGAAMRTATANIHIKVSPWMDLLNLEIDGEPYQKTSTQLTLEFAYPTELGIDAVLLSGAAVKKAGASGSLSVSADKTAYALPITLKDGTLENDDVNVTIPWTALGDSYADQVAYLTQNNLLGAPEAFHHGGTVGAHVRRELVIESIEEYHLTEPAQNGAPEIDDSTTYIQVKFKKEGCLPMPGLTLADVKLATYAGSSEVQAALGKYGMDAGAYGTAPGAAVAYRLVWLEDDDAWVLRIHLKSVLEGGWIALSLDGAGKDWHPLNAPAPVPLHMGKDGPPVRYYYIKTTDGAIAQPLDAATNAQDLPSYVAIGDGDDDGFDLGGDPYPLRVNALSTDYDPDAAEDHVIGGLYIDGALLTHKISGNGDGGNGGNGDGSGGNGDSDDSDGWQETQYDVSPGDGGDVFDITTDGDPTTKNLVDTLLLSLPPETLAKLANGWHEAITLLKDGGYARGRFLYEVHQPPSLGQPIDRDPDPPRPGAPKASYDDINGNTLEIIRGTSYDWKILADGMPTPAITVAAPPGLPQGVTFADRGDGTGVFRITTVATREAKDLPKITLAAHDPTGYYPDDTADFTVKVVWVPGTPQNFAISTANGAVTLNWDKPKTNGNSPITAYKASWAERSSAGALKWSDPVELGAGALNGDGGKASGLAGPGVATGTEFSLPFPGVDAKKSLAFQLWAANDVGDGDIAIASNDRSIGGEIDGEVDNQTDSPVQVRVSAMTGNAEPAASAVFTVPARSKGTFHFDGLAPNYYNVVGEINYKDEDGDQKNDGGNPDYYKVTKTTRVTAQSAQRVQFVVKKGRTQSIVYIEPGTQLPQINVNGLDSLFLDTGENGLFDKDDEDLVTNGGIVEFKLHEKPQTAVSPEAVSMLTAAITKNGHKADLIVDLSVVKTRYDSKWATLPAISANKPNPRTLIALPSLVEVMLPYEKATAVAGVYRLHDYGEGKGPVPESLTKIPATADGHPPELGDATLTGEGYYLDSSTGNPYVLMFLNKFSPYAIALAPTQTGPGGGGGGASGPGRTTPAAVTPETPTGGALSHGAYVEGYPGGTFRPDGPLTRAETAMMFYRIETEGLAQTLVGATAPGRPLSATAATNANAANGANGITPAATKKFPDVKTGAWHETAIYYLTEKGVISGDTEGTFRPDDPITRAELTAMMERIHADPKTTANPFSDLTARHWAYSQILSSTAKGWIQGYPDGTFRPDAQITRAEAVKVVNSWLGRRKFERGFAALHPSPYSDLAPSYWGYADIIEASIAHEFRYSTEGDEVWKR